MDASEKIKISVEATVNAPVGMVWKRWTTPEDIIIWHNASDDWHTLAAVNDIREGGRFSFRMEAIDGSAGFDFCGTYSTVIPNKKLVYTLDDGRNVSIDFTSYGNKTHIFEVFEAETENTIDLQRGGWQAILDKLKKHTELNKE
ncbi:MAG: SRPBCC domain-containing protein [Bacteroidota bacterium]